MNWKEHPHLFANGKFKLKAKSMFGDYNVVDFDCTKDVVDIFPDDKLIARPIEDMTEREMQDYLNQPEIVGISERYMKQYILMIKEQIEMDLLSFKEARKLLSIGCYPFSDTEDVIFKPKEK